MKLLTVLAALLGSAQAQCSWSLNSDKGHNEIWYTGSDGAAKVVFSEQFGSVLYVGTGNLEINDYRGEFWTSDYTESRVGLKIDSARNLDDFYLLVTFENDYTLELDCNEASASLSGNTATIDRWWLRFHADDAEEAVYGGGEQFSFHNLRGNKFAMLTREQGMGRNISELVSWVSNRCCDAAGDYHHSYWPQPVFLVMNPRTNKHYYVNAFHDEFSWLDFTNDKFHEIEFHIAKELKTDLMVKMDMDFGANYPETVQKLALSQGDQAKLPSWTVEGTIIGVQGGTDRVMEILANSSFYDVPVTGIWIQDWSGQIFTDFGDRVFWNWEWNETQYPALPEKIEELGQQGTYFLNYINPHLLNTNTSKLYVEGHELGYFVKNRTTGDDLEQEFGFAPYKVVSIDLSNPEASEWFKQKIIIENTINFGFKGWMADFGEYLPYSEDALFWDGTDGTTWHNKYPEKWAALNWDALVETNTVGDCFYFSRAGWSGMRQHSTSAWAGDQNVDFSYGDGLPTTVPAALSLGSSGFGLTHFDIGGYTGFLPLYRTDDLFYRSAEAAVFTPVMRTHEGNQPGNNFQYYQDRCSLKNYARLCQMHLILADYIDFLMDENTNLGKPVQRAMLWVAETAEEMEQVKDYKYQYMLGDDMVVAPVIRKGKVKQTLYLPAGEWISIWDDLRKDVIQGPKNGFEVESRIGYPPVFYRKDSEFESDFRQIARQHGGRLPCPITPSGTETEYDAFERILTDEL